MDPMIRLESGGNPRAVNARTGATGLRQFTPAALQAAGVYRPAGGDGWDGVFSIPGFAGVRSRQDFMANPQAQEAAYAAHRANLLREVDRRGLRQYVGQTVAGAPVTEDAILRAMHFAGPAGAARFLSTGGRYNPSDGNLRVTEYLARTGGRAAPAPAATLQPVPAAPAAMPALPPVPMAAAPGQAPTPGGIGWGDIFSGLAAAAASMNRNAPRRA